MFKLLHVFQRCCRSSPVRSRATRCRRRRRATTCSSPWPGSSARCTRRRPGGRRRPARCGAERPATAGQIAGRAELVSHRDYYPGNVVFRDGLPVALIDFDLAMPTTRLYDIANALWYWAPLRDPRDRAPAFADADIPHRVAVFADAYGMTARHRAELAPFAVDMARRYHEDSRVSAELDPVFRKLWEDGAKDELPRAEAWLREAAPAITARLGQPAGPGPGAARRQDRCRWSSPRASVAAGPGRGPPAQPRDARRGDHPTVRRAGPGVRRRHRVGARLRDQRRRLRDGRAGKALGGHSLREGAAEGRWAAATGKPPAYPRKRLLHRFTKRLRGNASRNARTFSRRLRRRPGGRQAFFARVSRPGCITSWCRSAAVCLEHRT